MNLLKTSLFMAPLRPGLLVTTAIIAISALLPQQSNADGIDWTVAPYFWGSGVGLDVTVNSDPVIGTDVPLSDLIDKLDGVFMGHFEGRGEHFGLFVDTIYLSLADNNVIPIGPGGPIVGDLITDMNLTLKLYELGGVYRIGNDDPGSAAFDMVLGARLVDVDQNLDLILPQRPRSESSQPVNRSLGDRRIFWWSLGWQVHRQMALQSTSRHRWWWHRRHVQYTRSSRLYLWPVWFIFA